jgi:hypothetical protein
MTVQAAESADEKLQNSEVGRVLQSDSSRADNAKHISQSVNTSSIQYINGPDLKTAVMIEKSTTRSKKNVFVLCMSTVFA